MNTAQYICKRHGEVDAYVWPRTGWRTCSVCRATTGAASAAQWKKNHREIVNQQTRIIRRNVRIETIAAYGGKCACCGEWRLEFLSLDHKHGGGYAERKAKKTWGRGGIGFYLHLKRDGFPRKDELRVLCMNCNTAMGFFGHCPHQTPNTLTLVESKP